jgi:hypothetical protein
MAVVSAIRAVAAPRLVIGLGTQRSGTSWVADYRAAHPEIGFSPIKETHFFDSIHSPVNRDALRERERLRRHLPAIWRAPGRSISQRLTLLRRYVGMLRYRPESYRAFLTTAAAGLPVGGEFTPAYATLPEEGLAALDALLDRPKYLIVFRDPVSRFLSQIDHSLRGRPLVGDPVALLDEPAFAARCDYAGAMARIDAVIPPERLHVMFFETLFDPDRHADECARLCRFVGVGDSPGLPSRRVNAGRRAARPTVDRSAVAARLRPQYEWALGRFGDAVPPEWRRSLAAGAPS